MMSSWWNQDLVETKKVNIKVEYESTPIRHLAVQCPDCKNWFHGYNIIEDECQYSYQLINAKCTCPKCGSEFKIDYKSDIEESGEFPEFYDKCLKQKVSWE